MVMVEKGIWDEGSELIGEGGVVQGGGGTVR